VPRDDEGRPSPRWSEPPTGGDPHRDVTGALHDVSNALTVLLGWVAEARASRGSPEQVDHALAIVESRARAARNLARRAIGADEAIAPSDEALDVVVADVVEALSVEAQRAGVTVFVVRRCPGVRVTAPADASQVLTNLVLNAVAWTPPGGVVTLETEADASTVTVVVQDQGPGIQSKEASRVFTGASTRLGGAGVGLRHARAVARAEGGELELLEQVPSRGARFRLRWPRVEPSFSRAPVSAPRPAVLAGTRVLVVEDDADVATLLEGALGARGAEVVIARSAGELAMRATEKHDAALVDLSPIAHDVRGAVNVLRRGSPDVALVFISGSAVGLPEEIESAHIVWVRKPFEVSEIVEAILESRTPSAKLRMSPGGSEALPASSSRTPAPSSEGAAESDRDAAPGTPPRAPR
jgi:CheY-like chemotaxis protein